MPDQEIKQKIAEKDITCPYCDSTVDNDDAYSYDDPFEHVDQYEGTEFTCDQCEKKFWAEKHVTIDYWTKPDCELNNDQHNYKESQLTNDTTFFCTVCGDCCIHSMVEGAKAQGHTFEYLDIVKDDGEDEDEEETKKSDIVDQDEAETVSEMVAEGASDEGI